MNSTLINKTLKNRFILEYSKIILFITLICSLTGCTSIRLISEYDEITDKKINELQEKVTSHFVVLKRVVGTDDAKYEKYISFYDEAKADIEVLTIRANAIPKNSILTTQLNLFKQNLLDLEQLHKLGFNSETQITTIQNAFNSAFTLVIKFLLELKRGE